MVVCFRGLRDYGFFCKDGMEVGSGLVLGWNWWYKLGIGVFDNGKVLKGVDNKMLFREWGVWGE